MRGRASLALSAEECRLSRLCLTGLADPDGSSAAILCDPALHQPLWMSKTSTDATGALMQSASWRLGGCEFAQNGVDHSGDVRVPADARQLNALVERGMRRDAIEMQKLEGSQPQSNRDWLGESLIRTLKQRLNPRVERDLPAEGAEDERCREVAILRREICRRAE